MSIQIPGKTGDITPSHLTAGSDTTTLHRTAPTTHGVGISFLQDDDNDLYDGLREFWRDQDIDPGDEVAIAADIDFLDGDDFVWLFKSSGYKAGAENAHGNWKQWYKYHVKLRRVERDEYGEIDSLHKPPVSVHVVVEPQKDGMTYDPQKNDGKHKTVDLPYGEGSRISVQTTYAERPSQPIRRAIDALSDVLEDAGKDHLADVGSIKRPSCRIWKLESYLRFDIEKKHALVRTINKSENLIDVGGGSEIETFRERQAEGWLECRVQSDRWSLLGCQPAETTVEHNDGSESREVYERELKVYQANGWHEKPETHYAHHPKVEASLGAGKNPHIDEWHETLDRLRELVVTHCEWAGITDDDLVADDYFLPGQQPAIEVEHPEGRQEDLKRYYNRFEAVIYSECIKRANHAQYDILSVIVERYGATYDELEAETGYSRSNLQYHVGQLVDTGLLETTGNPAIVCFAAETLMEIAQEAIEDVASYFDEETLGKRRVEREKRAEDRTEKRESGEANGTHEREDDEGDLGPEARGGDESDEPLPFAYLEEWSGTLQMAMDQLVDDDHPRGERDIRIRAFPGHDPDGGWK